MFLRRSKKLLNPFRSFIEGLESRTLLSSSAGGDIMTPNIIYNTATQSSSSSTGSVQGYTPAEIEKAYGFDSISLSGAVKATGAGQTIAIVDAYSDPNIVSDLGVFDSEFNLPAASLKIVNQTGGSTQPTADAGWAGEISLDVEWAHAIAPDANILLVEASSDNTSDLMAAVNEARHAAGVSVVSISWGGSENFSWGGGESTSQLSYDSYFTTPAGHQSETFVAAAGDSGASSGVEWPASSPNVIAVGGTTLTTQSDGTYVSETGWSGTSGGYSQVEAEPSYQDTVQTTGARSVPDVAYDADPNTGFAVYDSVSYEGEVGWQEVGGTSAGAPQWAALIAIADQSRALAGKSTLDGVSQTLPMLYDLYSAPDTTDYSTYTSYFNDVIDSDNSGEFHFRWGGFGDNNQATSGYDTVTGLGTPQAAAIVDALTGTSSTSSGGSSSSGSGSSSSGGTTTSGGTTSSGSGSGSSTTDNLPASPLTATVISTLPTSAVDGSSGSIKLSLTNTTLESFSGSVTVTLYVSTDNSLSSADTSFATITLPKVNIKSDATKVENIKFEYPSGTAAGSYYVLASVSTVSTDAPSDAASSSAISLAPASVALSTAFKNDTPIAVTSAEDTVAVTITNDGNVTANGTISLQLYASGDMEIDSTAETLGKALTRTIHLKAGHSITLHLRFQAPADKVSGAYYLIASATSDTTPVDANATDDTAVLATLA
jgi:subtilase family serine protease